MNVTRDEAAEALGEIRRAGIRMQQLQAYSGAAPHFMIWGAVWLVAYSVTDLWPHYSNWAWSICLTIGVGASFAAGYMIRRNRKRAPDESKDVAASAYSARFAVLFVVFFFFFLCIFTVNPVETTRQGSTLISILFPFMYMAVGAFAGWRIFAIGAVAAALIMVGHFFLREHFYLYMGVVAGGSLMLAGLWLRKA